MPPRKAKPAAAIEVNDFKVAYKAPPTLARFMLSDAMVRGVRGPVRSGKSSCNVNEIMRRALQQQAGKGGIKRVRCGVIRNTYAELRDTTVKTWLDWYPETEVGPFSWTKMDHVIKRGDLELELNFRALDKPEDVAKLKSMEWTFCWINEAAEIPKSIVLMARDRVGQFPSRKDEGVTWGGVFMDTNSMDDDHWWAKLAEEKPVDWAFFDQPGGLIEVENGKFIANPLAENMEAIGKDYYLSRVSGNSLEHIRVFYCNQYGFVRQGQPVIPEFSEALHVAPRKLEAVKGVPIRVGLDFGLTPAAIIGQKLVDGRWIWLREIESYELGGTGIQTFAPILIDYLQEHFRGFEIATIWGDPAGDERDPIKETDTVFRILNQELKPYGMKAVAAPVPGNSFTIRREVLAGALNRVTGGHPRVMFCPSMKTTIKGLKGGYYYRRVQVAGEDRYQNEPVKTRHSHLIEAGEYMMLGAGEGVQLLRGKRKAEGAPPEPEHLYAGRDRVRYNDHSWMN